MGKEKLKYLIPNQYTLIIAQCDKQCTFHTRGSLVIHMYGLCSLTSLCQTLAKSIIISEREKGACRMSRFVSKIQSLFTIL